MSLTIPVVFWLMMSGGVLALVHRIGLPMWRHAGASGSVAAGVVLAGLTAFLLMSHRLAKTTRRSFCDEVAMVTLTLTQEAWVQRWAEKCARVEREGAQALSVQLARSLPSAPPRPRGRL